MRAFDCFAAVLFGLLAHAPAAVAQAYDYGPLQSDPTPERLGAVIDDALPTGNGVHHFLLSYCTTWPGVVLPPDVRSRHADEITVVLQWQYWNLEHVGDEIRVTVSFDQQPTRIVIPLVAITYFADVPADVEVWLRPGESGAERCARNAESV